MPGFWQRIFRKRPSSISVPVPVEFPTYAKRAIQLLTDSDGQLEDTQVIDLFISNSIPYKEAVELLLFLPTAFCRHMLPQIS